MSQALTEQALLEDVSTLPSHMQNIYLQLVSALDHCLHKLQKLGVRPNHIGEDFIEKIVNRLLDEDLTQAELESFIEDELQKQLLESAELTALC